MCRFPYNLTTYLKISFLFSYSCKIIHNYLPLWNIELCYFKRRFPKLIGLSDKNLNYRLDYYFKLELHYCQCDFDAARKQNVSDDCGRQCRYVRKTFLTFQVTLGMDMIAVSRRQNRSYNDAKCSSTAASKPQSMTPLTPNIRA